MNIRSCLLSSTLNLGRQSSDSRRIILSRIADLNPNETLGPTNNLYATMLLAWDHTRSATDSHCSGGLTRHHLTFRRPIFLPLIQSASWAIQLREKKKYQMLAFQDSKPPRFSRAVMRAILGEGSALVHPLRLSARLDNSLAKSARRQLPRSNRGILGTRFAF